MFRMILKETFSIMFADQFDNFKIKLMLLGKVTNCNLSRLIDWPCLCPLSIDFVLCWLIPYTFKKS